MDKKRFQETFSAIHASEKTAMEVLHMKNPGKKFPKGRVLRLAIAVALAACLLGTAVFAASVAHEGFRARVNSTTDARTPTDEQGISRNGTVYDISFDIEFHEDAPETIETYYVPRIPDIYKQSFGYAYGGPDFDHITTITYAWDVPNGEKKGIMFYQYSSDYFDHVQMGTSIFADPDREPVMEQKVLGGVEGLLILAPDETEYGRQYFYWGNGEYVFEMKFPYDFTGEQMAQIIAGISEVEDIRQYLVSMTEEEISKALE